MADAGRTPHQRQRPAGDMPLHVRPDGGIIIGEALFGDAGLRPEHAVGMGETHVRVGRLRLARRRLGDRFLAHDVARVLVFAQALEGGLAQYVAAGPAAELDLGHARRLHPYDIAARFGGERALEGLCCSLSRSSSA